MGDSELRLVSLWLITEPGYPPGRGEVKLKTRILLQPGLHVGRFMNRTVV